MLICLHRNTSSAEEKNDHQLDQQSEISPDPPKHEPIQKLEPLIFVQYKTEEECSQGAMDYNDVAEAKYDALGAATYKQQQQEVDKHEDDKHEEVVVKKEHDALSALDFPKVIDEDLTRTKDLFSKASASDSCVPLSAGGAGPLNTSETLELADVKPSTPGNVQKAAVQERDSPDSSNRQKSTNVEKTTDIKKENSDSAKLDVGHSAEMSSGIQSKASDGSCFNEKSAVETSNVVLAVDCDVSGRVDHPPLPVMVSVTGAFPKKTSPKVVSAAPRKLTGPKVKPSRTRGGKTTTRRRAPRGRSALNPRGYGYSMAFLPQESSSSNTESNKPSENTPSAVEHSSGTSAVTANTTTITASGTKPNAVKNPTYQAKKLRLDQITGKLSAQRQCEAQATVQSPSAFQLADHSPPPPCLPPSPVSLPPPQAHSPSAVTSPYPIDSYPPPLLYAPSLAAPCCSNPHHQHQPVYPPPGPPSHPSLPHGVHLPPRHLLSHQEYHPGSSGYMMYPPHGPPYPRPCMGTCKYSYNVVELQLGFWGFILLILWKGGRRGREGQNEEQS